MAKVRLPFSFCPLHSVMPWLSSPSSPVLVRSCPGSPVLAVFSWQSCPGSLVLPVLSCPSHSGCPAKAVLFELPCSGRHFLAVLSFLIYLGCIVLAVLCHGSRVLPVPSACPDLAILFLQASPFSPLLAVMPSAALP
jgi:hypothetical protein